MRWASGAGNDAIPTDDIASPSPANTLLLSESPVPSPDPSRACWQAAARTTGNAIEPGRCPSATAARKSRRLPATPRPFRAAPRAFQDEARTSQDAGRIFQDAARTVLDEARAFQDEARAFQDEARTSQDAGRIFQDAAQTVRDEARTFRDEARTLQDEGRIFRDAARTLQDEARTPQDASPTAGFYPIFEENRHFATKTRLSSPSRQPPPVLQSTGS
jgi:hypothetical protein